MAYVLLFVPEGDNVLEVRVQFSTTLHYCPSIGASSSTNWPIIQGKQKTGLTIFWPDNGLDTGPVLLQKEVDITPTDTLGSVYFDKPFPLGVEAMLEGIESVRAGNPPRLVQDETNATYESWCRKADVEVDWAQPAQVMALAT